MVPHAPMCPACRTTVAPRRRMIPRYCPECGARLPAPASASYPPLPPYSELRVETAGGAVVSLILGLVSLCVPMLGMFLGLIAIMVGSSVRDQVRHSGGRLRGAGLATAGITLGWISIAIWLLVCLGAL